MGDESKGKRPRRRLPDLRGASPQRSSESGGESPPEQRTFRRGDDNLMIGPVMLRDYLEQHEMRWVVELRDAVRGLDLSPMVRAYKPLGPPPIHPSITLSLIVYGMLQRQWSLRELEGLARRDVGAWYLCGGEQPDHSTIGDFVQMHMELLQNEQRFALWTKQIIRDLKLGSTDLVAADGTVTESFASRFRSLGAEAAKRKAQRAAESAAQSPADPALQQKSEEAAQIAQRAEERAEQRAYKGRDAGGNVINPVDPDAVPMPRKDGVVRPGFKSSVLALVERIIVGTRVEPSSETAAIRPMLEQHRTIFGSFPATTLADAGYFSAGLIALFAELELDFLCPSGTAIDDDSWEKKSPKSKLPKRLFVYQSDADCYRCPQGRVLNHDKDYRDGEGRALSEYRCTECADCRRRDQCTTSPRGRTVKRYAGDDLKEVLAEVMKHPLARARYKRRASMVEPIFAALTERQGLRRFHRRGLKAVRAEFTLHCLAYNLGRAQRIRARLRVLWLWLDRAAGTRGIELTAVVVMEVILEQ